MNVQPFPNFRWPEHWRDALDLELEQGKRYARRVLASKWLTRRYLGLGDFPPGWDHVTKHEGWRERGGE